MEIRMSSPRVLRVAIAAPLMLLLAACSAPLRVTTEAPVHGIQVARVEPSWGADTTPAQINFWLYAEDALDFQVCGFPGVPMKVAGGPVGEPVGVFSFGPSLETIGGVNGLPVSLHAGHLLI